MEAILPIIGFFLGCVLIHVSLISSKNYRLPYKTVSVLLSLLIPNALNWFAFVSPRHLPIEYYFPGTLAGIIFYVTFIYFVHFRRNILELKTYAASFSCQPYGYPTMVDFLGGRYEGFSDKVEKCREEIRALVATKNDHLRTYMLKSARQLAIFRNLLYTTIDSSDELGYIFATLFNFKSSFFAASDLDFTFYFLHENQQQLEILKTTRTDEPGALNVNNEKLIQRSLDIDGPMLASLQLKARHIRGSRLVVEKYSECVVCSFLKSDSGKPLFLLSLHAKGDAAAQQLRLLFDSTLLSDLSLAISEKLRIITSNFSQSELYEILWRNR